MRATRITANLQVADVEATKSFYTGFLGLSTEEFNLGWVAPDGNVVNVVAHRD